MKFILSKSLFDAGADMLPLFALINCALQEWHRIEIEDEDDPAFINWKHTQHMQIQTELDTAIESSYLMEALEPSRIMVFVASANVPEFPDAMPRVSCNEALELANRPFQVLVENARNDAAFLLAVASEEQRELLQKKISERRLEFENGGGLGEMKVCLDSDRFNVRLNRLCYWILFDSDALRPGEPSATSNQVKERCETLGLAHHQLCRRASENYIPKNVLRGWMSERPRRRRAMFEAFVRLSDDQRFHYNMKGGFDADANRNDAKAGNLYDSIAGQDRETLRHGFGNDIGRLFHDVVFDRKHVVRDGIASELDAVINELVALMR